MSHQYGNPKCQCQRCKGANPAYAVRRTEVKARLDLALTMRRVNARLVEAGYEKLTQEQWDCALDVNRTTESHGMFDDLWARVLGMKEAYREELGVDIDACLDDMNPSAKALRQIHWLLDGQEWDSETTENVAEVLRRVGYDVTEVAVELDDDVPESLYHPTEDDVKEFTAYLRTLTDAQVRGVYERENNAGRFQYTDLARQEAMRRGLTVEG